MNKIQWVKVFLVGLVVIFSASALAQQSPTGLIDLPPSQQEPAPLRSDQYPSAQDLTSKYPSYDPQTNFYFNQFPYYDRSTGYFIYGPHEQQDPNFPVQDSVANKYPYYDSPTGNFVYGPIVTADPNIPVPDPDAMPLHVDYAKPNTDGWAADMPKGNIANPNISNPRLPVPNIAKPNVDLQKF